MLRGFIVTSMLLLAMEHATYAAYNPFWQAVPISPTAIADDPQLASMQTFDLMVTLTGSILRYRALFMPLPSGQYYNHPFGSNVRPPEGLVDAFPAVAYDTFLDGPPQGYTFVGATFVGPFGPSIVSGTTVNAQWLTQQFFPSTGTWRLGRFTFPVGSVPPVTGFVASTNAIIPQIPEPACSALALSFAVLRMRRRSCGIWE